MWEIPLWECEIFDDVTFGKGLYLPSRYLSHLIITIRYFKLLLWTHFTSFFKRMSKPMYFILFETLTGKLCECICRNVCGTQLPYTHSDITLPDLIQMDVGFAQRRAWAHTFKVRYLRSDGATANNWIDSQLHLHLFTFLTASAHFSFTFSCADCARVCVRSSLLSVCVIVCYYRREREKLVFFKEHPQN